jgi:hypothetical protein
MDTVNIAGLSGRQPPESDYRDGGRRDVVDRDPDKVGCWTCAPTWIGNSGTCPATYNRDAKLRRRLDELDKIRPGCSTAPGPSRLRLVRIFRLHGLTFAISRVATPPTMPAPKSSQYR